MWQNLPWGFIQPLYTVVHLLTSPISKSVVSPSPAVISADPTALRTLPLALAFGLGIPSVLMCLSSPNIINHETKQLFLFIWQLFPLWIGLAHHLLIAIPRELSSSSFSPLKKVAASRASTLRGLRSTYATALIVAAVIHWSIIFLVLFNSQLASLRIVPNILVASDPGAVFRLWPVVPNFAHFANIPQVSDIAEGFLVLLQYDTLFAGLGVLIWSMWLRHRARGGKSGLRILASAVTQIMVFGPCGAAVGMMWQRDEDVFRKSAGKEGF